MLGVSSNLSNQTIIIVKSETELCRLEETWNSVAKNALLPMQDYTWIRACASTIHKDAQLNIVTVADQDGVQAIAPLVQCPEDGLKRLALMGVATLADPTDFIYRDGQALQKLVSVLVKMKRPLNLGRVLSDSITIETLKRYTGLTNVVAERSGDGYSFIDLDDTWLIPEHNLSSRRRSDFRRALRRAEKIGQVRSEVITPMLSELDHLFALAIEVEDRSWKGEAGSSLLRDPVRKAFFKNYTLLACKNGKLRIALLRIGEQIAAMQIAVVHQGRFWLLKIGYDSQFATCSPGIILTRETIQYATEAGLKSYEFLGSVEPWTAVWTKSERKCTVLRLYPLGFAGGVALGKDVTKVGLKKLNMLTGVRDQ